VFKFPAELIQAGGEILLSAIHRLITSVWDKEELLDQWKESITVPIHKKGDKTDCNNYRGISLLSTSYKMLSNILLSRLSPYIDEIIEDHQCGFRRNRSTTDQILHSSHTGEKMGIQRDSTSAIDFKNAYDSVRRKVLYNILVESGVFMKLVRLIKMCLNETYNIRDCRILSYNIHLSESFPIQNGLKHGDALSPLP
jgi:hypothetical protein